jgi:hypothetical protein
MYLNIFPLPPSLSVEVSEVEEADQLHIHRILLNDFLLEITVIVCKTWSTALENVK